MASALKKAIEDFFVEEHKVQNGESVRRVKSGIFYWSSFWSFIIGLVLLSNDFMFGFALVLTACPILLLYPLVRFLFGGEDSAWAIVSTVITEELLKGQLTDLFGGKKRRK